jgi:hypothetical protein
MTTRNTESAIVDGKHLILLFLNLFLFISYIPKSNAPEEGVVQGELTLILTSEIFGFRA